MISRIRIQGFKSIHDISNLELGQVNVLIGANGSGKSNLLEAIGVLGAAAAGRVDDQALLRRGVRPGTPTLYKTSLRGTKFPRTIIFQASGTWAGVDAGYNVSLDNPISSPEPVWRYHSESLEKDGQRVVGRSQAGQKLRSESGEDIRLPTVLSEAGFFALLHGYPELGGAPASLLETLQEYAIYTPTTPFLRGIVPDVLQREPVGLLGGRLPEAIADTLDLENGRFGRMDLDDVLELLDWIEELDIAKPSLEFVSSSIPSPPRIVRFKDRWMRESRNQLAAYDASEGALYVLFVLVLALHSRSPRFFAIDNFDQALNPRLARTLTRHFAQQMLQSEPPRQVLLTTHSPLVLDGLNLSDDRIRLFAVDRDSKGATKINRVQVSDEILKAAPPNLSLSNLWVMGRLGGVPVL